MINKLIYLLVRLDLPYYDIDYHNLHLRFNCKTMSTTLILLSVYELTDL